MSNEERLPSVPSNQESGESSPDLPTAASPSSFYVVNKFYPANTTALGRLVIDTQTPRIDCCPTHPNLTSEDVAIIDRYELRKTIKRANGSKSRDKLGEFSSRFRNTSDDDNIPVTEKKYELLNAEKWLKKLCDEKTTRAWLEAVMKFGWKAYIIVGICTVDKSSIRVDKLEQFHDLFNGGEVLGSGSLANGHEVIVAIQYRKVQFDWSSILHVDVPLFEMGDGRWIVNTGCMMGRDDCDIVEVNLQGTIEEEDIDEGEVFITDNLMIVF